jgi:hypothetical protein
VLWQIRGMYRGGPWWRKVSRVTEEEVRQKLASLRIEHRDLDHAIQALSNGGTADMLQLARLKKRKLKLRDQIAMLEDYLIPDIIA